MSTDDKISLKKDSPDESPKVTLDKDGSTGAPKVTLDKDGSTGAPKVTLDKESPKVTLEKETDEDDLDLDFEDEDLDLDLEDEEEEIEIPIAPPPSRPVSSTTSSRPTSYSSSYSSRSYSSSYSSERPRKKKFRIGCGTIIVVAILIVVLSVVGSIHINKARHSPNQIQIIATDKGQEYKPYVSTYTNGCYYIYFDYEVSAKSLGVSDMKVIAHIYENSTGKELGTLETSFSNMNLEAGETKRYDITWHDNQPQKNNNTFFLTVYDMDFEDLELTFEFDYIHFSDGGYYFGEE